MKRIGIGGIAIESCTFSPLPSTLADFVVLRGDALRVRYPFLPDWTWPGRADLCWRPALQAKALPGGSVRRADYEALKADLLDRVRAELPLDGFYFDLHGAMHVQGLDDAEADLACALRTVVGPDCVIIASMDLHGNVSAASSITVASLGDARAKMRLQKGLQGLGYVDPQPRYLTAPHEDVIETRRKACAMLVECLDRGAAPARAWARIPVLLPGERTSTFVEPGRSVYAALAESDRVPGVLDASLWVGYAWADEPRSSACAVVTAWAPAAAEHEARRIAGIYFAARRAFDFIAPADTAARCISRGLASSERPVFISDSGDNPTAGGAGDIPQVVAQLLAEPALASGAQTAIYASLPAPTAVQTCFAAGVGGSVRVTVGGVLDPVHGRPMALAGDVFSLFAQDEVGGDLAVLRCGGVRVILTSRRKPYHVISEFAKLGLDPRAHQLVVVKIGYLEPELRAAAARALLALTPGAVDQDIPRLPYRRVRRPLFPLDAETAPDADAVRVLPGRRVRPAQRPAG